MVKAPAVLGAVKVMVLPTLESFDHSTVPLLSASSTCTPMLSGLTVTDWSIEKPAASGSDNRE